jgi:hypothetical protein
MSHKHHARCGCGHDHDMLRELPAWVRHIALACLLLIILAIVVTAIRTSNNS